MKPAMAKWLFFWVWISLSPVTVFKASAQPSSSSDQVVLTELGQDLLKDFFKRMGLSRGKGHVSSRLEDASVTYLDVTIEGDFPPSVGREARHYLTHALQERGYQLSPSTSGERANVILTLKVQGLSDEFSSALRPWLIIAAMVSGLGLVILLLFWARRGTAALLIRQKVRPNPAAAAARASVPAVFGEAVGALLPRDAAVQQPSGPRAYRRELTSELAEVLDRYPVLSYTESSHNGSWDIRALASLPRQLLQERFAQLSFAEVLQLLACTDQLTCRKILMHLRLQPSVRKRLEKELILLEERRHRTVSSDNTWMRLAKARVATGGAHRAPGP